MKTSNGKAHVITLGTARFGLLRGGPSDGRCYPLGSEIPEVLDVPVETDDQPIHGLAVRTVRYELHDGFYRFTEAAHGAAAA
jgi:hypothetical protein